MATAQAAVAVPAFTPASYVLGHGSFPVRLVGGVDLTSDGLTDLVVLSDNGLVRRFARRPDGSFVPDTIATDAVFPWTVGAGDFNADGRTDLVYATAGGLRVLLQNTAGFAAGTLIDTGNAAQHELVESLVVGDFNGDGKPDIAAADNDEANTGTPGTDAFIAWGLGNGAFDTTRPRIPAHRWPRKLFGVDANGDGRADLYAGSAAGFVGVVRYDVASTAFVYAPLTANGLDAVADASPGDVNGDGKPDLALLMEGRSGQYLRFERGGGDFTFVQQGATIALPYAASGVRLGDFDGDGKLDALVALVSNAGASATLLRGLGDFTFFGAELINGGFNATGLARGDYNNDGKLDFALIDTDGGRLVVFLQN